MMREVRPIAQLGKYLGCVNQWRDQAAEAGSRRAVGRVERERRPDNGVDTCRDTLGRAETLDPTYMTSRVGVGIRSRRQAFFSP